MISRDWKQALFAAFVVFGGLCLPKLTEAQEKKEAVVSSFKYTETFRSEVGEADRDAANPNRKESGTYRVEIVMPVSAFMPAQIEASDIFGVTMGNLDIQIGASQTMDGKYRRNIRLDYTQGDDKKTPQRTIGKVRIRWTLNKVMMTIEGTMPEMGSPAGSLYVEEEPGKFTETTLAIVRYGKQAREFRVNIHGEVKRAKRENGDGTATTVELMGEGKPFEGGGFGGGGGGQP